MRRGISILKEEARAYFAPLRMCGRAILAATHSLLEDCRQL